MTPAIAELLPLVNAAFWHGFTVLLRIATVISLMPAFGEKSIPARVKLAIALAFVVIIAPAVSPTHLGIHFDNLFWLTLTEVLSGLIIGLGMRMFVLALQTAGSIAAQSTSLSQILGGAAADPLPALGYTLVIGGLALAVTVGLHVKTAELLIFSYDVLPIGKLPNGSVISKWGLSQVKTAFELAFTLAAPFVIVSVLYNLALGAINKAMPQLMVAFVGAPVITFAGLFLLFLSAPLLLSVWLIALDRFMGNPFAVNP